MKPEKRQVMIVDETPQKQDYSDILDALKDATKVYNEDDYSLSQNFVWAEKADQKTQEFITRQHAVAKKIQRSFQPFRIIEFDEETKKPLYEADGSYKTKEIPNPFGEKVYGLIMLPANDWAILNRNTDQNTILKGILLGMGGNNNENILENEEKPKQSLTQKMMPKSINNYFKKKQKKENIVFGGE